MTYISANPHQGARRAFFSLYPHASEEDYIDEYDLPASDEEIGSPTLIALAGVCHACVATMGHVLEVDDLKLICFSGGYFEATAKERFG